MGQYHYVVNLDKKQYLHPHRMGDGLKLLEFGCSSNGTMTALALLLARDNGHGGGDLRENDAVVGSWAGDRIAIVGDYGQDGLYKTASEEYEEVSPKVRAAMAKDSWIATHMRPDE